MRYERGTKDRLLDFWYSLHLESIEIGLEREQELRANGYISTANELDEGRKQEKVVELNKRLHRDEYSKGEGEHIADSYINVREGDEVPEVEVIDEDTRDRVLDKSYYDGSRVIRVKDWKVERDARGAWDKSFCAWIDSINADFGTKKFYKPFELYRQQAYGWLSEGARFNDFKTDMEKLEYARMEKRKSTANSLYFLNRYHSLKDSDRGDSGYTAWECQEVVCYLFDLGANLLIGKPRQIGFTSTIGGLGNKRITLHKDYFCKFITHTLKKGEEIFEDKIKYPFAHLPFYMKPSVANEQENLLRLLYKPKKGDIMGVDSKLQVVAPTVTAINGGTPNLVMVDEIGMIGILTEMLNEGRPTLFWFNPKTQRIEMKRQFIAWGTGGEVSGGGFAFEREFRTALQAWEDRDFQYGIIPLFFNAFAKPGVTAEILEKEKKFYYARGEKSKVQYHQTYPITIDDMFMVSPETLVDIERINAGITKSRKSDRRFGYLEPIFDRNSPMPDTSDVPYKITGAKFVPVEDEEMFNAPVCIIQPPEEGWVNRYFEGTDPIFAESGHSKMSSAIWDSVTQQPAAIMNFRAEDYRYSYLQSLLLGIYYDTKNPRNLVESNVGSGYMDYCEAKGYWRSLIPNKMIAPHLQTPSGGKMGIRKSGSTAKFIIHKLQEMLETFGENILVEDFWIQLKTFVRKTTSAGNEVFKVENAKFYYDDVIDAVTYAYICAQSFSHLTPINTNNSKQTKSFYRYELDENFNLSLRRKVK